MKWIDFLELVNRVDNNIRRDEDPEVVIRRSDPSVGPCASTPLSMLGRGIDWDRNKIILLPAEPLYLRDDHEEIEHLRAQLNSMAWELSQARRRIQQLEKNNG